MRWTRPCLLILSALALSACGPGPQTGVDDDALDRLDRAPTSERPTEPPEDLAALPAPRLPSPPLSYAGDRRPDWARSPFTDRFDNTPADNSISDAGATLGRVLFYDRRLSQNGRTACASCHRQDRAFTDPRPLSVGFDGGRTRRHSMSLINLRYYARGSMFWDERAPTLEDQVLMPIQDEVEMGLDLEELVRRVGATDYYPALFAAAFGDAEVTSDRIARALAQFIRAITSFSSRWDAEIGRGQDIAEDFAGFTPQENEGKRIFFGQHDPALRGGCGTCHLTGNPLAFAPPGAPRGDNVAFFFVDQPRNNGLPDGDDDGLAEATGRPQDAGRFKSPSLRNVALTGPYMHDGRFETLAEVLRFYDRGIRPHANLDPALTGPDGRPLRFRLDRRQQASLLAFLGTLTDTAVTSDPRFSDPFPAAR